MRSHFIITVLVISLLPLVCFSADDLQFEGKSMEAWINNLIGLPDKTGEHFDDRRKSDEIQQKAVEAIRMMGSREFDYLVEQLCSTNRSKIPVARIEMVFSIVGSNAIPEIPKLIKVFNQDELMAWQATACLKSIGTNSIPPLMTALVNRNIKVRQNAAYALGQFGQPAKTAVSLLLERLKVEKLQVRGRIITSLGLINQYPEKVVPALIPYLSSEDTDIRGNAAFAMIGFGKNARTAAPKLFKLMSDENETVRNNAAGALQHMEADMGKEYVTLLLSNASNADQKVREYISQELSKRGANTNSSK